MTETNGTVSEFRYRGLSRLNWAMVALLLSVAVIFLLRDDFLVGVLCLAGGMWGLLAELSRRATVVTATPASLRRANRLWGRAREMRWKAVDTVSTTGYGKRPPDRDYIRFVALEDEWGVRLEVDSHLVNFVELLRIMRARLPDSVDAQPLSELEAELSGAGEAEHTG